MNKKKIISGVIVILLLLSFCWIVEALKTKKSARRDNPTSFATGTGGYKAFYLLLKDMGYKVSRLEKPINDPSVEGKNLILILPYEGFLDEKKAEEIYKWVEKGNRLIIADVWESPLWNRISVSTNEVESDPEETMKSLPKDGLTSNVTSLKTVGNWRFNLPSDKKQPFTVYLEDPMGVICASTKVGKGEVYILSTPEMFNNSFIGEDDNAIFITNLISKLEGDEILFDETVHGYGEEGETSEGYPFSLKAQMVFGQLALVIIILYSIYLIRFGRPRKIIDKAARMSVEYIHSFGGLFYKAQSRKFAATKILHGFKRRTGKIYGINPEISDDKFFQNLKGFPGIHEEKIAKIQKLYKKATESKEISEGELLQLGVDLEKAVNEISL